MSNSHSNSINIPKHSDIDNLRVTTVNETSNLIVVMCIHDYYSFYPNSFQPSFGETVLFNMINADRIFRYGRLNPGIVLIF